MSLRKLLVSVVWIFIGCSDAVICDEYDFATKESYDELNDNLTNLFQDSGDTISIVQYFSIRACMEALELRLDGFEEYLLNDPNLDSMLFRVGTYEWYDLVVMSPEPSAPGETTTCIYHHSENVAEII